VDSILEEMKEIIPYLKSSTDRIDRILASVHLERAQLIFFSFFFQCLTLVESERISTLNTVSGFEMEKHCQVFWPLSVIQ